MAGGVDLMQNLAPRPFIFCELSSKARVEAIPAVTGIRYRPEIDGLRAIAVVSVILYHAGLGFSGGYVGVDVFFVISGYLITSILKKEQEATGSISLSNFWSRRVRRLAPALAVCVLITFGVAWFLFLPRDLQRFAQSMVSQALVASNFYFWMRAGYFEGASELKPLLHTWSLSIEEQFYILLPLLMWFFRKKTSSIPRCLAAGLLLSFFLCIGLTPKYPDTAFFLLPARAWELLLGCVLAYVPAWKGSRGLRNGFALLGFSMILSAVVVYGPDTSFPGVAALLPCLGSCLLIYSNTHNLTSVGKFLALEPLRRIGLASYSLYLWHWPVLAFAGYYALLDSVGVRVFFVLLGCLLGYFSYLWVEQTTRRASWMKTRVFSFAIASTCCMVALGLAVHFAKGFPSRVPERVLQIAKVQYDYGKYRGGKHVQEDGFFVFGKQGVVPTLFIWGDSHAMALLPCIDKLAKDSNVAGLAAVGFGVAPCLDTDGGGQKIFDYLKRHQFDRVVLIARWQYYVEENGFQESFENTLLSLNEAGISPVIMRQVPEVTGSEVPRAFALRAWKGTGTQQMGITTGDFQQQRSKTEILFSGTDAAVLDPQDFFFPEEAGKMRLTMDGLPIYRDRDHLSAKGGFILSDFLRTALFESEAK